MLASPHYGERWGRHWLDIARYAEDQAHTFQARKYPNGYRYRDWVVQALNDDLPYDRFILEQIAGDLLPGTPDSSSSRLIALGYFALGPVYYADAGCAPKAAADELDDRVDTLTRGFLGLTVACARCHDHKFDPISQEDYVALAGIFSSTAYREAPLVPQAVVDQYNLTQKQVKNCETALQNFQQSQTKPLSEAVARNASKYLLAVWRLEHPAPKTPALKSSELAKQLGLQSFILDRFRKHLAASNSTKLPQLKGWIEAQNRPVAETDSAAPTASSEPPPEIVQAAEAFQAEIVSTFAERDRLDQEYAAAVAAAPKAEQKKVSKPALEPAKAEFLKALTGSRGLCEVPKDKVEGLLDDATRPKLETLKSELETARKAAPPKYPFAHSLTEGKAANMKIHVRGNPTRTGAEVPRRFLSILSSGKPTLFTEGSGRLELARAIASPDNPLTARVMVNRIWQQHFGRGLVTTASNFGRLGERPSHPQLLDYLASRLIQHGWSLKAMHREILLSATYRQCADFDARSFEIDPENRLLWRANRRRLDVESFRDALLAVSGNLDRKIGGPSVNLAAADASRRTMYGAVSRHNLDGLLRLFDFPDPNISSARRTVTTVPLQQLFVLNSEFMVRQARSLAKRLTDRTELDDAGRIRSAYTLLFGRPATEAEIGLALEFLAASPATTTAGTKTELSPWEQYAQILLGSNEFTFID